MQEISIELARDEIARNSVGISPELKPIAEQLDPAYQAILPYILHLWQGIIGFGNVAPFVTGLRDTLRLSMRGVRAVRSAIDSGLVADVGCGWGSLSLALTREGYIVTSCDYVYQHAVATKLVCPDARVYHADARDLSMLADGIFDFVCVKDVIEHVGDHSIPSGPSGRNFAQQYRAVREAGRIARLGSSVYFSTGNFRFPLDGECNKWFFHWLPEEKRKAYMEVCNFSSDKYWLLTWEELAFLFEASGLTVDSVTTPDTECWFDFMVKNLDKALDERFDTYLKQVIMDLIRNDPRYFSSFEIKLTKTSAKPRMPLNNLSLAVRALGGDTDEPNQRKKVLNELLDQESDYGHSD